MKIIAGTVDIKSKIKSTKVEKDLIKSVEVSISKENRSLNNVDKLASKLVSDYKSKILDTAEASELGLDKEDVEIYRIKTLNVNNGVIEAVFEFRPSEKYANFVREQILSAIEDDGSFLTPEGDEYTKQEIKDLDNDVVADLFSERALYPNAEWSDIPKASVMFLI